MTKLIAKLQYKTFETGEFIEIRERSYNELIDVIKAFPWHKERQQITIDLTNPSITIEGQNNDFLKLAVFFNGKYALHYFNRNETLFTKSFMSPDESFKYIRAFFGQSPFDTTDFKKEATWLQHNLKHFVTQDFRYYLTPRSLFKYLKSTSGICLLSTFVIITFFSIGKFSPIHPGLAIFLTLYVFLIGGGLHLILFGNYFQYANDKILIMSKGNDTFYFGKKDSPIKYDKNNIHRITIIRSKGSKNPIGAFAVVNIDFKNGAEIVIPNILIDYADVQKKLSTCIITEEGGFPFIRPQLPPT